MPPANVRARPAKRPPQTMPLVVRPGEVAAVLAFNAVLLVGMWVRHGGVQLLGNASANLTAIGELTALLGTYAALVQLVLMGRIPWLERSFGMDRLAHWHRWLGFSTVSLILAHVLFTTVGYALGDGKSAFAEMWTFITGYPYMLMAIAATILFVLIAGTSIRAARRRLQYETWHFVHFYTYLAIALAFGHEIAVGTDLTTDRVAQAYWIALYVAAFGMLLWFRVVTPVRLSLRHRLRIESIVPEAPGVVSIHITGERLGELRPRAGQWFNWRFLTPEGWWRPHPFSLSAAPNGRSLRITVKSVGGGTAELHDLQPGTRVAIEGPYGLFTALRRTQPKVALIAAGIGITPLRALAEELPVARGSVTLVYRVRSLDDVLFREELERLARERRIEVHLLVGRRGHGDVPADPFSPRRLRQLIPDIARRDVFICGPPAMLLEVGESLAELHVPARQIHYERFALL